MVSLWRCRAVWIRPRVCDLRARWTARPRGSCGTWQRVLVDSDSESWISIVDLKRDAHRGTARRSVSMELELLSLEVAPTTFDLWLWPMTLTFNRGWAMIMTHTHAKGQGQKSPGSKVSGNRWTIGFFWHQKTRVSGLLCGVVCFILHLAILLELRFMTDRQTQRTKHSSCGKNCYKKPKCLLEWRDWPCMFNVQLRKAIVCNFTAVCRVRLSLQQHFLWC